MTKTIAELRNIKQVNGILLNERCQLCGKKIKQKCLTCLLEGRTAGYCINHHYENNHKPIWIGVFE